MTQLPAVSLAAVPGRRLRTMNWLKKSNAVASRAFRT